MNELFHTPSPLFHCLGQLVGVDLKPLALDAWEMRVTCPLPSNTQPVAGTISTTSALDGGLAAGIFLACCCAVIAEVRVSDHTTSVLRGWFGLGGKPPRRVRVNSLPLETLSRALMITLPTSPFPKVLVISFAPLANANELVVIHTYFLARGVQALCNGNIRPSSLALRGKGWGQNRTAPNPNRCRFNQEPLYSNRY